MINNHNHTTLQTTTKHRRSQEQWRTHNEEFTVTLGSIIGNRKRFSG